MIYLIIFFLLVILTLVFDVKKKKRGYKFWYFLILVILILLLGLRYRVGGDSLSYEDNFKYLPHIGELNKIEYGTIEYQHQPFWYLLCAISKFFNVSFVCFQFIHAVIINTSIFIIFKKYCRMPFMAVLLYSYLYFFYYNTEILRESLAIILTLFAWPYLIKGKYTIYYCIVFLAFLFHVSALITFIFPLLFKLLNKRYNLSFVMVFGAVLLIISGNIISYLVESILGYGVLHVAGASRIELYSTTMANVNGIVFGVLSLMPTLLTYKLVNKSGYNQDGTYFILNITLLFQLFSITIALGRFLNYLNIPFLIIIVNHLSMVIQENQMKLKTLVISVVAFLFISKTYYYVKDMSEYNLGRSARFYNRYIPYHSIFDPQVEHTRENIFINQFDR